MQEPQHNKPELLNLPVFRVPIYANVSEPSESEKRKMQEIILATSQLLNQEGEEDRKK